MLDPVTPPGASGGGGPFVVDLLAGNAVVAKLELRAVVTPRGGSRKAFRLKLQVVCDSHIRKEVRNTVLRISRRGGGRQSLALAETAPVGRGERFDDVDIGKELLFFGLGDGTSRNARIRLEWERVRGGMFGARKEKTVVAQLDLQVTEIQKFRKGNPFCVPWLESSGVTTMMVCFVDEVHSNSSRTKLCLQLAR